MKRAVLSICLLCLGLPSFAKDPQATHPAKVISQDIGSEDHGLAVMPIGTMIAGVPITRTHNIVVIETPKYRLTLSEIGRKFVILPVNETIQVSQEGDQILVLDSKKKKHKFAVVHAEKLPSPQNDGKTVEEGRTTN